MFVAGFMGSPAMNFLPGEIVSESGELGVAFADGEGKPTTLKLPAGALADGRQGRKVVFGIRPENVTHHDPRRGNRRDAELIEAPVEVVEPTGAETMVVVRVGEREMIARFEPDEAPVVGERVTLALDMGKACLFDADTENLI